MIDPESLAVEVMLFCGRNPDAFPAERAALTERFARVDAEALAEAAVDAENGRCWDLFDELMSRWPVQTPGGDYYYAHNWKGLIDPRWPADWPDRILAEHDAKGAP